MGTFNHLWYLHCFQGFLRRKSESSVIRLRIWKMFTSGFTPKDTVVPWWNQEKGVWGSMKVKYEQIHRGNQLLDRLMFCTEGFKPCCKIWPQNLHPLVRWWEQQFLDEVSGGLKCWFYWDSPILVDSWMLKTAAGSSSVAGSGLSKSSPLCTRPKRSNS